MTVLLVVDDEVDIVDTFRFILELEGYEVMTALNGEEALKRVRQQRPDLIISDMMMPVLNGIALCRELRRHEETQTIPIILSSSAIPAAENKHWDLFIRKPADLHSLLLDIRMLLDGRA
ncbi:MAG: response regulator [Sulfurifustaceae bacterium]